MFKQWQRLQADGQLGAGADLGWGHFGRRKNDIWDNWCLTLVQPVAESVEDDVLFARRHQADRAAAHRGAIVNVVLKDEDLKKQTK